MKTSNVCHTRASPEVGFVELFVVEGLVAKGRHVEVPSAGEHLAVGLEPLAGVDVGLQHALVVEHVAHGLRDDHVNAARQLYFLNLARNHLDCALQIVRLHQRLQTQVTGYNTPFGSCLKTGHHSIFVISYKENKKNNTRMLDTLFIEDFTDNMEEYFHF